MKKRILTLVLCLTMVVSMFSGCGKKSSNSDGDATFRQLYGSEVTTLNYLTTSNTNDFKLSANVIDTLVEYDQYGNVQPSLAVKWEISDDKLTYTFHLRENQKWVDSTGNAVAEVTANDFVSSMKYILTSEYESATAELAFGVILNAEEYFNQTVTDFTQVGVKALDNTTLVYTLAEPCPYFLSSLTYVNYMPAYGPKLEELGASFGAATGPDTILYCGAYYLSEFKPQEKHVYTKNTKNWDADKVYVTKVNETYNAESTTLAPTMASRDQVDFAIITSDILDEWQNDASKSETISRSRLKSDYSYFYSFNFDPQFDSVYEPENWKLAVNNENFRQSMMAALDRIKALSVGEPSTPEVTLQNTVTPKTFTNLEGKDFTAFGDLATIMARDSFNTTAALEYKTKAMEELKTQGVTFPIKILMKYNPTIANWDSECAVVEQQMEGVLGTDYIDIIVEAGPAENFLSETRRNGNYAFLKCAWGADYADPNTFTDPFKEGNNYNFMDLTMAEGNQTANTVGEYYKLVAAAQEQNTDLTARYEAYAKAEAFLINHAIVIPYSVSAMEYQVNKLNVFEGQYASFGVSVYRYKGQKLYDKPISMDDFIAYRTAWENVMNSK